MKKLSKIIRILTIAPIIAAVMLTIIYLTRPEQIGGAINFIMSLLFLTVLPAISYPLQPIMPYFKHQGREGQRNLAIIAANIGYIAGIIYAFAAQTPQELLIIFLTYFLSGLLIVLFNKALKIRASGHACGIAGPIAILIYFVSPWALLGIVVLAAAWWASLAMKRHASKELVIGSLLSIASLFISVLTVRLIEG